MHERSTQQQQHNAASHIGHQQEAVPTVLTLPVCVCAFVLYLCTSVCICVQVHSFTGTVEEALKAVDMGFYIGVNGWWVLLQ